MRPHEINFLQASVYKSWPGQTSLTAAQREVAQNKLRRANFDELKHDPG